MRCFFPVIKFIVIFLQAQGIVSINCPTNNEMWRERSKRFGCNPYVNGTYHCIFAVNGSDPIPKLEETCMTPTLINSEEVGCPKVRLLNGIPKFSRPFLPCKDNSGRCPGPDHRLYYTDQLYEFSDCIKGDENIQTITSSTIGVIASTEDSLSSTTTASAMTESPKIVTSSKRCGACKTDNKFAEPHAKSIEIASLFFLLMSFTFLVILLFCPNNFRKCLKLIREKVIKEISVIRTSPQQDNGVQERQDIEYNAVTSNDHPSESTDL